MIVTVNRSLKAQGWDAIAGNFNPFGHAYVQQDTFAVDKLLEQIDSRVAVLIVGASAQHLISTALKRQLSLSVADFSPNMLKELAKVTAGLPQYTEYEQDVLRPWSTELSEKFQYIIAAQLIDIFTLAETKQFFAQLAAIMQPQAVFRTLIDIGLYEMDKVILSWAEKMGIADEIFDPINKTINFDKAMPVAKALNGELSRGVPIEKVHRWLAHRGQESRYYAEDITEEMVNAEVTGGRFIMEQKYALPDTNESCLFCEFRWQPA